tara:strand:+ start:178 stop:912 length:735 start_codon:yes stop_codon:yes gene_type:complete
LDAKVVALELVFQHFLRSADFGVDTNQLRRQLLAFEFAILAERVYLVEVVSVVLKVSLLFENEGSEVDQIVQFLAVVVRDHVVHLQGEHVLDLFGVGVLVVSDNDHFAVLGPQKIEHVPATDQVVLGRLDGHVLVGDGVVDTLDVVFVHVRVFAYVHAVFECRDVLLDEFAVSLVTVTVGIGNRNRSFYNVFFFFVGRNRENRLFDGVQDKVRNGASGSKLLDNLVENVGSARMQKGVRRRFHI